MTVFGKIFTVLTSFVLPIVLAIIAGKRIQGGWRLVLYGCMTFLLFQGLLRLPLLQLVLPMMDWYVYLSAAKPLLHGLLLASSAALFEEGGRYLVMRLLLPTRTSVKEAVAFGIGHGGVEALLFVGVNAVVTLFMATATAPVLLFAAGAERVFAMAFHVAASVMVAASVREKKIGFLLLAFLLHTLLDLIAVIVPLFGLSVLVTEACLGVFSLSLVPYIVRTWKKSKAAAVPDAESAEQIHTERTLPQ